MMRGLRAWRGGPMFRSIATCCLLVIASLALAEGTSAGLGAGCAAEIQSATRAVSLPITATPLDLESPNDEITLTEVRIQQLRTASFPELTRVDLKVRAFHSTSDYFRTRFSLPRFFLPWRMRYFLEVNPDIATRQAPTDGVCAILAHELVHIAALSHGNRIHRLGLVRLFSKRYTATFERRTDLDAIHRGYGDGLKNYRNWVYNHIPPGNLKQKKRNYFSPEEIENIQRRLREKPELFVYWSKHVPLNLQEVLGDAK